jgi:hypothetical protein
VSGLLKDVGAAANSYKVATLAAGGCAEAVTAVMAGNVDAA